MSDALSRAFVEIEPDFDEFNRAVNTAVRNATRVLESRIRSSLSNVERRFESFGDQAADSTQDAFREMARDADEAADDMIDSIQRVSGRRIALDVDIDREGTFSRFLSSITGIRLPVSGFLALGSAASAAAGAVIQLGAALAPAVGIIAGLPAAIGVGAAAIGTLQVATAGFSEAMAAAFEDTETFNTAIENLSPNAQAAAQAFREVVPELDALKTSVQDAFFSEFDDTIRNVADTLLGPLSEGMSLAAEQTGGLVASLLDVAGSTAGVSFVTSTFETLNGILSQLQGPVSDLFTAFLNLGSAVNTAFGGEEAGAGLAAMIQQFADFIAEATASGEAVGWVEDALAVFGQIGDIISPLVDIFLTIGSAAQTTGGNILGVFGEALNTFAEFLSSAEGTRTLISLFEAFNTIGAAFGDILAGIGPALPPLIGGISQLVGAVAPLIPPLALIVGDLLTALAPLFGIIAQAISPLIGPISTLASQIGGFLVTAIEGLMPLIESLLTALAGPLSAAIAVVSAVLTALLPLFEALLPILEPILVLMTPFTQIFGVLAEILAAVLVPIIQFLGDILLWLVDNVITPYVVPAIEFLAEQMQGFLVTAIQTLVENMQLAGEGFKIIWEFIKGIIGDRINEIVAIWTGFQVALQLGWNFINNNVFTPIKNGINLVKTGISLALDAIEGNWNSFISFIKGIPGKISSSLSNMFSPLASGFRSAINSIIRGWNNLSFSIPSVDIPGLGTVGGGTINTPNIPYLQTGGFTTAEGLAMLHPNEMVLPLSNSNGVNALADALRVAGAAGGNQPIQVVVQIGNETITSMVDTRINENSQTQLRRARAGTGRRI